MVFLVNIHDKNLVLPKLNNFTPPPLPPPQDSKPDALYLITDEFLWEAYASSKESQTITRQSKRYDKCMLTCVWIYEDIV